MPLGNFLPTLPWPLLDVIMNVVAGLGAIMMSYAILLESERRQDAVFIIASACLFIYALWVGNKIFSVAMAGVFLVSGWELIEILRGKHLHANIKA